MELSERKIKILNAIIRNYLETGEPVGSRTISKYSDLNLSSATIRNEMSDLEEMGYIVQPHTSAGRIPTDKGYRFYVDNMLNEKLSEISKREYDATKKEQELSEREDLLLEKVDKVETLLQNMAKVLANNTNYATMVSSPKSQARRIKFIQLSILDARQILCTIVSEKNKVVNKIVDVSKDVNQENIIRLNVALNTALAGLSMDEINLTVINQLISQAGEYEELVSDVLKAISGAIATEEQMRIYTSGATNIFKYPELSDRERASRLLTTFEEKTQLSELVNDDDNGIQVYIGSESPLSSMQDCSVVTASYTLEDGTKGTIGIIGPKRMDYEKVVDVIRSVKEQLGDVGDSGMSARLLEDKKTDE